MSALLRSSRDALLDLSNAVLPVFSRKSGIAQPSPAGGSIESMRDLYS
jgi:hypothetical protein